MNKKTLLFAAATYFATHMFVASADEIGHVYGPSDAPNTDQSIDDSSSFLDALLDTFDLSSGE